MKKTLLFLFAVLLVNIGFSNNNEDKEQQIFFYYQQGLKADNNEKDNASIGDALRYYYWSLALCYSYPESSNLTITDPDSEDVVLIQDWLYDRIDMLLGSIRFIPKKNPILKSRGSVVYEVIVTDGADRIPWLKFEYNNGNSIVESSVESGLASVELTDSDINRLDIRIDIENKLEAEARAQDVYEVMKTLEQIYFASAIKNVDLKKAKESVENTDYQDEGIVEKQAVMEDLLNENACNMEEFNGIMKVIEKAVRNNDLNSVKYCFTKEGYEMLSTLLSNGRYYILGTPEYKFVEYKNQVICRSLPMQFNFKNNVGFIRNVVFRFDKRSHKVASIAFKLSDIAEIDILGKDQWKPESRMILINFLEDYQTAYALKRRDYINKIFSDDALIVVGTVLKQKQKGDNMHLATETKVRYDTLSKGRYMEKLNVVFDNNEFINIRFLDTDFTQHKSGAELYGIQVKQEYLSSTYGDVGYLFLMVDLRDELPVIHVRTWEPEKTETPIGFDDIVVEML